MILRAGLAALLVLVCSAQAPDTESPERSGFAWWRLRPTDVATTGSTDVGAPGRRDARNAASEASGERRAVRVVYPALIADR